MRLSKRFILVCDDVRREDNGKLLIVGMYTHGILFHSFPVNISLTAVVGVECEEPGQSGFQAGLIFDEKKLVERRGMLKITGVGMAVFPLSFTRIELPKAGTLQIEFLVGTDRFTESFGVGLKEEQQ